MRFHYGRYGLATRVLLIIAGVWWCVETLRTFPDDLKEFRTTKVADVRWAMLASWAITVLVMTGLVLFTPGVVMEFVRLFS
ncbi:MAG TPA: hypothetical protein VM165_14650 [Planctomycetaceae bacterium]|nr:hypothetical protein [Planctomycetaceae bacterium]